MDSLVHFLAAIAPFAPLLSALAGSAGAVAAYLAIRLNASIHRERIAHETRRAEAARAGATYRYLVSEPLRRYIEELLEWSRTWLDPEARKLTDVARSNPGALDPAARAFTRAGKGEIDFLKTQFVVGVRVTTDTPLLRRVNASFQSFTDEFGTMVLAWAKNPRGSLTLATFRPLLERHAEALVAAVAARDPELLMAASASTPLPPAPPASPALPRAREGDSPRS